MRQTVQKFYTRLLALVAALLLLIPILPTAQAVSGDCGDGVTWELTGSVLRISGKGAMANYRELSLAPWAEYAQQIGSIIVEDGVTTVGSYAFFCLENVTAASLADSVKDVGEFAFFQCSALSLLDLGQGVQVLGKGAFERCTALRSVRLPSSLQTLCYHAFYRCEGLLDITVPASVTSMDNTVFGYCKRLQSAAILASISELPVWTFHGCESLRRITLNPSITKIGVEAFDEAVVELPVYASAPQDRVEHTTNHIDEAGVITKDQFISTPNSTITSQITEEKAAVDAVVENEEGWSEVAQQASKIDSNDVQVTIHLKGDAKVTGPQLGSFAGKDMSVTIHTQQGVLWHFNGKDLDRKTLKETYDLSFTVTPLGEERTDGQKTAVGIADAFLVQFHTPLDFKVEVELPLGRQFARTTATFFAPEGKRYNRMQDVRVDSKGAAHFYLGQVQTDTQYLIGINIPDPEAGSVSNAIIPDSMKEEYGDVEQVEQIDYIILRPKSSWGMDIKQVTWILAGVMGGCVVIVGVVVGILNKQRLKTGYVPEYEDEEK